MEDDTDVPQSLPPELSKRMWTQGSRYITSNDQVLQQQAYDAEADKVTVGDAFKASVEQDWVFASLERRGELNDPANAPDPDFVYTEELRKEYAADLPLEYQYTIAEEAHSLPHLQTISRHLHEKYERDKVFAMSGAAGMAARFGANMADPVNIVLTSLTAPISLVSKGGKMASALKGGALVATENIALEGALYLGDYSKSASDMLFAAAGGLALGGAAGALSARSGGIVDDMMRDLAHPAETVLEELGHNVPVAERSVVDMNDPLQALREEVQQIRAEREHANMAMQASESRVFKIDEEITRTFDELARLRDVAPNTGVSAMGQQLDTMTQALEFLARYDKAVLLNSKNSGEWPASSIPDPDLLEGDLRAMVGEYLGRKADLKRDIEEFNAHVERDTKVDLEPDAVASREARIAELEEKLTKLQVNQAKHLEKMDKMRRRAEAADKRRVVWEKKRKQALADLLARTKAGTTATKEAPAGVNDSVGAMRTDRSSQATEIKEDPQQPFSEEQMSYGKSAYEKMRWSIAAQFSKLKIGQLRWFGNNSVLDAVGREGGAVNKLSASEDADQMARTFRIRAARALFPAFPAWAKASGIGYFQRPFHRAKFGEEVAEIVRTGAQSKIAEVNEAAKVISDLFEELGEAARKAGVAGFENFTPNRNYLPRLINLSKAHELEHRFQGGMIKLLTSSIRSANPDIDPKYAEAIAEGYWRKMRVLDAGLDVNLNNLNSRHTLDSIEESLRTWIDPDTGKHLDTDVIEEVMNKLAVDKKAKGDKGPARSKHRVLLDEGVSMNLKDFNTGKAELVKVTDIFHNNVEHLLNSYLRQMTGRIAMAKVNPEWFGSDAGFKRFLNSTRIYAAQKLGMGRQEIDEEVALAQYVWDYMMGRPTEANIAGKYAQFGRMLRDWNYSRLMGQVGWAQIPEFANIVAFGGWRAMLSHVPALSRVMWRAKNGKLGDDLQEELELLLGTGADWLINPIGARFDEHGFGSQVLEAATRVTSAVSGMASINTLLHRLTARVVAQRFIKLASGKSTLDAKEQAWLGLTDAMRDRIYKQLNTHSDTVNSAFFKKGKDGKGGKVARLNVHKWDDKEAADIFVRSMGRLARKIIQENDIGSSARWMNTTTGKLLMQFRTFQNGAYEKQLLANKYIGFSNPMIIQAMTMPMFFGALAYMGQVHTNAAVRADGDEYRERMLEDKRVYAAAFGRAGWSSFLPGIMDTVADVTGNDPWFAHSRSSGQLSNPILGNPQYDLFFNKGYGAVKGIVAPMVNDNYQFSQSDLRSLFGMSLFQNTILGASALSYLAEDKPLRSQ